jgi:Flp pilus assembly protein TadD
MSTVDQLYDEAIKLQESEDLEGAIQKLEALVSLDPNYALAHAALSVFYGKQEEHDKAVEHAEKVCQLEPEDPFSYMAKSIICQKASRLPEAEQAMNMAMQKEWESRRPA